MFLLTKGELATVLRGELAEKQSIFIMRAFREMRHYIKQNQQFVTSYYHGRFADEFFDRKYKFKK